jgi:thioredoxin-related protein
MRTVLSALVAGFIVLLSWHATGRAAVDGVAAPRVPPMEVLVFEHPDCTYCRIFRRDVLPRYREAMPTDTVPPLRFVDIVESDTDNLGLKRRIDMVPTVVLMRNGNEVDRIAGYWGPENFFKLLTGMLARME